MAESMWEQIDIIDSIVDLNKCAGSMMYILICDGGIACSTKIVDINKYMAKEDVLVDYLSDNEGIMLLHALVLNHHALPTDIPDALKNNYELMCLQKTVSGMIEFEEQVDMDAVVDFIEFEIDSPYVSIDDFAVILCKKVDFVLQATSPSVEMTPLHKKEMGVSKHAG